MWRHVRRRSAKGKSPAVKEGMKVPSPDILTGEDRIFFMFSVGCIVKIVCWIFTVGDIVKLVPVVFGRLLCGEDRILDTHCLLYSEDRILRYYVLITVCSIVKIVS